MNIGEHLRRARVAAGLTQADIAAAVGVTPPSVSQWESDRTVPSVAALIVIARITNTSLDALTGLHWNISATSESSGGSVVAMYQLQDAAAALTGGEAEQIGEMPVRFPFPGAGAAFRIADSSNAPRFSPGDVIIVSAETPPQPGDMVVIVHNGAVLVRKLTSTGAVALHPDWAGREIPSSEMTVLGVVVEHTIPRRI